MGYIKEPKGVDFIIQSEPLTDDERVTISEFIRQYKSEHLDKKVTENARVKSSKRKTLTANPAQSGTASGA